MNPFTAKMEELLNKAHAKADSIVSESVLELQQQIIEATPVDTGQAKSNWFIETDQCSGRTTTDKEQGNIAEAKQLLARLPSGKSRPAYYYLFNNLPYIRVLEYGLYPNPPKNPTGKTVNGYSTQAPQGFFRLSVAGWQQIVERVAAARKDNI
jgi:hypothetical protein